MYLSLHSGDTPSTGNELTGNAYARVAVPVNQITISGTGVTITNSQKITWPTPTGAWSRIESVGICTAASGNNYIYSFDIPQSSAPQTGSEVSIAAGAMDITLT